MKISKQKVTLLMAKQDLRQQDLANKAEMSRGNLSIIINGKSCRPVTIFRIASALGVDVAEILEEEG